ATVIAGRSWSVVRRRARVRSTPRTIGGGTAAFGCGSLITLDIATVVGGAGAGTGAGVGAGAGAEAVTRRGAVAGLGVAGRGAGEAGKTAAVALTVHATDEARLGRVVVGGGLGRDGGEADDRRGGYDGCGGEQTAPHAR